MSEKNVNLKNYGPDAWFMAEESVAGCLLVEPAECLPLVRQIVSADDFGLEQAKSVFMSACLLADARKPIDPTTILNQAKESELPLTDEWVRQTMQAYLTTANVEFNATIIRESAILRKSKEIGMALVEEGITPQDAVEQLQDTLSHRVTLLATPREDAVEFFQYLKSVSSGDVKPFLATGLDNLDDMLGGGLISEGLITLAGRPGQGKTVAALVIAENVAAAGGKVLYESLEMSKEQLWARRVSRRSRVPYKKLMNGSFDQETQHDWKAIIDAMSDLSKRNIIINSTNAKMSDIERHVRQAGKLDLIVIDHLGLIIPDKVTDSLYLPTTMASHALKRLAKSTGTPILMLCQLNRANTQRQDKRGTLADLRNSGAIEEDSDAVIFIHRESYYLPPAQQPAPNEPQTMEFNVAKNRHGETGTVYMDFMGMYANIMAQEQYGGGFSHYSSDTPYDG